MWWIDVERSSRELMERLAPMSALDREAVELVDLCELTPAEAARELGVSTGALRVRLVRTRARLKREGGGSWLGSKTASGPNSSSSTARCSRAPRPRAAPPRPRLLRRRGPLAALGLALAAALAALVIGLLPRRGPSAYAVVTNPDGTVTVTIRELEGVEPANERLAQLGVPVRVAPVTERLPDDARQLPRRSCRPTRPGRSTSPNAGPAGFSVRIDPAAIPPGDTVLLTAREVRPGFVALRALLIEGPPPSCWSRPGQPPANARRRGG